MRLREACEVVLTEITAHVRPPTLTGLANVVKKSPDTKRAGDVAVKEWGGVVVVMMVELHGE